MMAPLHKELLNARYQQLVDALYDIGEADRSKLFEYIQTRSEGIFSTTHATVKGFLGELKSYIGSLHVATRESDLEYIITSIGDKFEVFVGAVNNVKAGKH